LSELESIRSIATREFGAEVDQIMLAKAWRIAVEVHALQQDKSGESYMFHLARVADAVETPQEKVCALLHDVLEDTSDPGAYARIIEKEFPPEVLRCCEALCHCKGEPYEDYIRCVSENPLARKIKLADLHDNMNPERLSKLPKETYLRLLAKYSAAIKYLKGER